MSDTPSHLIALDRLRGVLSLDRERRTVRVLAGTWLSELTDYLAREAPELMFPLDPTERSASVGGMLSTNAGGARALAFGSIRAWAQGLVVEYPAATRSRSNGARSPHRTSPLRSRTATPFGRSPEDRSISSSAPKAPWETISMGTADD